VGKFHLPQVGSFALPLTDVNRRTVEGRNGGTLTPRSPGSNGGVHRGPDLFPRANILRAIAAQALAEVQVEGKGKSRRQVQMAMVGHAVIELQKQVAALLGTPLATETS